MKQLPEEVPEIDFRNHTCWAKVSRVVDGDTFDINILLPATKVGEVLIPDLKTGVDRLAFTGRLRCNGINALEMKTPQGKIAKEVASKILREHHNMIWLVFPNKKEKYGRLLATVYFDEDQKQPYNDLLIAYRDEEYGVIAEPYDGGKKT